MDEKYDLIHFHEAWVHGIIAGRSPAKGPGMEMLSANKIYYAK